MKLAGHELMTVMIVDTSLEVHYTMISVFALLKFTMKNFLKNPVTKIISCMYINIKSVH